MIRMYASREITDWMTAVGTVGAVIVALLLARRQNAEHLRMTCLVGYVQGGTRDGGGGFVGDRLEPLVRINATNDGPSAVTVNSFAWRAGWIRKSYWWQSLPATAGSTRMPARLEARGDEATIYVPANRLIGKPESISAFIRRSKIPWLLARSVRVSAGTTTGRTFYGRPSAGVLKILTTGKMPPDRPV